MEKMYKLFAPALKFGEASQVFRNLEDPTMKTALKKANEAYLHWAELQYKSWVPGDKATFWTLVKMSRIAKAHHTPIRNANGHYFKMNLDSFSEFLYLIDKEMTGNFMGVIDLSDGEKKQFALRNIIEESIASSQLEGANTTRSVAKKMLLEGRKPHDHSEQMIVNNHQAMLKIENEFRNEKISWEHICELHRIITFNTISPEKQGVLRETLDEHGEPLVIKPWDDRSISYVAPSKDFVEAELPSLIDFANDEGSSDFIHPLIKAIMIHFWIGLLHPFEDGNGRLARILFYWYMLKNNYWTFFYLSLSEKIKKSAKAYSMAYVYSEQDDCDLTYFIHYNIEKLKLARKDFQEYAQKKITENRAMMRLNPKIVRFNDRQMKLLLHFHHNKEDRTSLEGHQRYYGVKKLTAINDLKELVEKGFLAKKKYGRRVYYFPTEKISKLF